MAGSTTGPLHLGERGYYDEHRHWHPETPMLPDEARVRPETVPLEVLATHRQDCKCLPCGRYPVPEELSQAKTRYAGRHRRRR